MDDDIDDLLLGSEDPTKDLVLAQVEKKFKSKNKYRFLFKSGILQIDGLEYVFEKGNGDFKWKAESGERKAETRNFGLQPESAKRKREPRVSTRKCKSDGWP